MKVSLVTVCYNAAETVAETVASVFRQRGVEIEYVVVDGASSDGTPEILRRILADAPANVSVSFSSEPDHGLYDAINKGLRRATGDIVGLLNADDRFEDESVLRDVVAGFEDGVDGVYGDIRFVRKRGDRTVRYYSSRPWRPWMHRWGYMPAHPTLYVRRSVIARFGEYKADYRISADFEWMVRVLCRGALRTRYLPRCLVTMNLGGASTAGLGAVWRLNCENVRANRENGYFCILPMMLPKYFYKILGYAFRHGRT